MDPASPAPLPGGGWRWAFVAFRFGDGATQALVPLAIVLEYGLPLWVLAVTTACMNLVGVPASFLWGAAIDRAAHRRRVVVTGFLAAGGSMAILALLPPLPLYIAAAMAFTVFGVATAPAASTLALLGRERADWAKATTSLSRRTGLAFLSGMALTIALGFALRDPPFAAVFLACAAICLLAGAVAARTVPQDLPPRGQLPFDAAVAQAGQRRFDRPVFFPARLRHSPTWTALAQGVRAHPLLPVGLIVTFAGSICFFTSYPGVLASELGLSAGIVLLCQAPSHIVSPLAYPWAGRFGSRAGHGIGIARGALLRLVGIPALAGGVLVLGAAAVPLLVAAHALMGLSFSLIQVNSPLVLAATHPGGRGQGVGLHHAALGVGTLSGSVLAFVLLRLFHFSVSYGASIALTFLGVLCLVTAGRRGHAAGT